MASLSSLHSEDAGTQQEPATCMVLQLARAPPAGSVSRPEHDVPWTEATCFFPTSLPGLHTEMWPCILSFTRAFIPPPKAAEIINWAEGYLGTRRLPGASFPVAEGGAGKISEKTNKRKNTPMAAVAINTCFGCRLTDEQMTLGGPVQNMGQG